MVFYKLIMKVLLSLLIVIAVLQPGFIASVPFWKSIPSIRAGQIDSVTNLMTAEDTSTTLTDSTDNFAQIPGLTNVSQLQYGLSLISYESWMTDTFSFNITLVDLQLQLIKVRFTVLDNTFFTQAKVHYLLIWRDAARGVGPTSLNSSAQINIEVIYGCYLTQLLLTNNNRTQTVGARQFSDIATAANKDGLLVISMISGLKLSNSVGNNDHIKITPSLVLHTNGSYYLNYAVDVQHNNLLTFFCVSTVIAEPTVIKETYKVNFEYKTYSLNANNTGLGDVPYSARYDGADRMFFGISQFNLSMSDTRYLRVETANISLVSMLYAGNSALNQITYHTIYFAQQTCNGTDFIYDPINYICVPSPSNCIRSKTAPLPNVCVPCHYSCLTCNIGNSVIDCATCPANVHRTISASKCPCDLNYTDAGVQMCQLCSVTMPGCLSCTSKTICSQCDYANNFMNTTGTNNSCQCLTTHTLTTGFCLPYPGCLIAGYYNNLIACQTCDTASNFTMEKSNFSCKCLPGFMPQTNKTCIDICSDNITGYGRCDDGNNITGDGCDQNCNIQNGYVCPYNTSNITGLPGISVCVLKQELTVSYLYAQRQIGTNAFKMAFQVSPAQSGLKSTSFDKNFNTTLPIASQKIYCDPITNIIYLEGVYLQDLEGSAQTFSISFNNMTFYADSQTVPFTATGINAQLVLDQYASSNTILEYIIMAEAFVALLVAIFASVVGLKLIGIELLIPLQLIYFSLSTISQQRSYNFVLNNFKYANGFNTLVTYSYARTYSQSKSLVAMNYETEFLLSTNLMLAIFVFVLVWLLIHHLRLKYKEYKLESFLEANSIAVPLPSYQKQNSVDSEEERENDDENVKLKKKKKSSGDSQLQKQQSKLREDHHRSFKVFSFQVDRVYFIFYLILINQMMFGFIIMTLNVPISTFNYPQEINVLACNFIFFIFIGNIVFISYDQQSNKMIAFTCIKDRYAYIYLLMNFIIITALSMSFQESLSGYMMAALTLAFPLLVLKEKPYGSVLLSLENVVALYLQVMLFICEVIICMIQTSANEKTSLLYSFLIMGLVAVGEVLTIIRLAVKVNFKKAFDDLKNPHQDEDLDKKNKKVIEKNLDLLEEDKNISIIPPESVKNDLIPKNKMVDWQSKNTEEYESVRQREFEDPNEEGNQLDHEDEASENKEVKLNELQILKKRLRNNLKLKKEQDMLKKGI